MSNRKIDFNQQEKEEIVNLYTSGKNTKIIGKELKVNPRRVRRLLAELNLIKSSTHDRFSDEFRQQILKEYQDGSPSTKIAEKHNIMVASVIKIIKKLGVKVKMGELKTIQWSEEEKNSILERWNNKESLESIAESFEVSPPTIKKILIEQGIEKKNFKVCGEKCHNWNNGKIKIEGYIYVRLYKDDPYFCMVQNTRKNASYVAEHRLVVAKYLGRPLEKEEQVHHINHNRKDFNDISNLELRLGAHGNGGCYKCNVCGSKDISAIKLSESVAQSFPPLTFIC